MTRRWLMSLGFAAAALLTSTATLATTAQPSAADPALEARVMVVAEDGVASIWALGDLSKAPTVPRNTPEKGR